MKIVVQTKAGERTFDCAADEKLLYAGLRQGVALPYECATGTCGTCKARAISGSIVPGWSAAPARSYLKPDRGEFLLCQESAAGDCTVFVPGKIPPEIELLPRPAYHWGTLGAYARLTADVVAFALDLDPAMTFVPGQFAILAVPEVDGGRAYSMVNFAAPAGRLEFVIKAKPGGKFSEWLFAADRNGTRVHVFGPLGRAVYRPEEDKNFLCIAGGSGIAGMMAILARADGTGHFARRRGHVFFGVRTANDVFFLDRMDDIAARSGGNLAVTVALSEGNAPDNLRARHAHLRFATGFVHAVAAQTMAGQYDNVVAFVAGPPPMVDGALRMLIMDARLPAKDIRYDKFG
ncbi:MAG: 2Fe-2S iron-sulfur cluster binding domain-containing protein [Alphaproteobacteria bacterium]|nr:2Fe-2S iron-sulfur cluster binding domain-containing protein [Alphaproteobacteria bacterium]MBM3949844.1 2Fe-2S iron-sulfur cluster binding domain-containing protein [Rhodospirillales bacterium]